MYDSANSKLVDVDASLKVAREELRIARIAVFSLQAGNFNFFDGNGILGELNDRTINVRDAEKQAQIAEQKVGALKQALQKQKQDLQTLRQQRQNLVTPPSESATKETSLSVVYKAPVSGKVLQIEKLAGNTVNRGEKLIVLRYEFEQPIIDAYLTQDQAAQIVVGSQATVLLPALGKLYQAQVVEIDLTGGFVSEVRGQYQFQGSQERSVYVRLALVAIAPVDKKQLPAGMPVELRIAKRTNIATTLFSH
jgi:multidrug resistance efflux pump